MELYKNKYRTKSTRLSYWDYSSNGYYFVTIYTKNKVHWFGDINCCRDAKSCVSTTDKPQIILSDIGQIAETCWRQIPDHFPFVQLDEFVIMPNHIHGLIIINKPNVETQGNAVTHDNASLQLQKNNFNIDASVKTQDPVETQDLASLQRQTLNKFGPQSKNLASIIRGYKAGVTILARKADPVFSWQPRYHDHIIRNDQSLKYIREYIHYNPDKWEYDRENDNDISNVVKERMWKEFLGKYSA